MYRTFNFRNFEIPKYRSFYIWLFQKLSSTPFILWSSREIQLVRISLWDICSVEYKVAFGTTCFTFARQSVARESSRRLKKKKKKSSSATFNDKRGSTGSRCRCVHRNSNNLWSYSPHLVERDSQCDLPTRIDKTFHVQCTIFIVCYEANEDKMGKRCNETIQRTLFHSPGELREKVSRIERSVSI